MSDSPIHTRIWREEAEPANAFAARAAYCHGYDVYGQMLGRARWADMVFLLFTGEAPTPAQAQLLDALAVALANPGPRDPSIHAAMCGGVSGSNAAASLMAALAVGAGLHGGSREVYLALTGWQRCGQDLDAWRDFLIATPPGPDDVWPEAEHPPGFDPHGVAMSGIVADALSVMARLSPGPCLPWLAAHRPALEAIAGLPLALSGVSAAALADLGLTPQAGEMLHLLLRLPGAAVHALEQQAYGFKRFPFPPVELLDDPLSPAFKASPCDADTQEAA